MGLFAVDFQLLSNSGTGDSWVSPQFRMTLKGHNIQPVMADIAWKSKVHIRHGNSNGGWLHSMPGEYARLGTVEQAIQLVEWDDDLTCWQVDAADPVVREEQAQKYVDREKDQKLQFDGYIHDGDNIRLRHCYTKVALSVSELPSIGSNKPYIREMRGVNYLKDPTSETVWRVELVSGVIPGLVDDYGLKLNALKDEKSSPVSNPVTAESRDPSERWHSIKGFRLYNEKMNCYLMSHKVFRNRHSSYQEVGCIQGDRQKSNTVFVVDNNVNPNLPASTQSLSYQPLSFLQKFIEVNKVMWWTHRDFSSPYHADNIYQSGSTKRNRDESHPWSWPFLNRGLNYYVSRETNNYVYLMGNPLIWWAASTTALVYMSKCISSVFRYLRNNGQCTFRNERERFGLTPFYSISSGTFFAGWVIHYFPFFVMDRHLYIYHYLPAMYFSILLLVSRLDRVWQNWSRKFRYTAALLFMAAIITSWYSLSPLAYGIDFGSRSQCETARSLGGWEFVCNRQNLALARPEAAPARIVVEDKSEHELHGLDGEHEHEHSEDEDGPDHDHVEYIEDDPDDYDEYDENHHDESDGDDYNNHDHDHDQAGPFIEEESEHYNHEHFYHPHGHTHGHGKGHGHGHEIHESSKEKPHTHHRQDQKHINNDKQQQQQQQHAATHEEQQPSQDAAPQVDSVHPNRAEITMAAAEARARSLEEKERLLVEKAALEAKHKELEARLHAHNLELERQIQLEESQKQQQRQLQEEHLRQQVNSNIDKSQVINQEEQLKDGIQHEDHPEYKTKDEHEGSGSQEILQQQLNAMENIMIMGTTLTP
ncbi:hypothetical protein BGZ76_007237 [Entomortierella beljakovae]|nr:hypothetical protein BGZ76_007237 [Entomortierella beljakovae]